MDDAVTASKKNRPTKKQLAANRANAAHSTGPRSEEGKARSRLNALKHGLLATEAVSAALEGEPERAAFDHLADRLENYYRPQGPVEEILIEKIAIATWRLKRLMRMDARDAYHTFAKRKNSHDAMAMMPEDLEPNDALRTAGLDVMTLAREPNATLLLRYESAINRDLYRAMGELRKVRKERGSFDESKDHLERQPPKKEPGALEGQNYQTNPNPPPVNGGDGLEARIEGESPPDGAPAG